MSPADLVVRPLQDLGQRQLDMGPDPLHVGVSLISHLLHERDQNVLAEPVTRLRHGRDGGEVSGNRTRREVSEHVGLAQRRLAIAIQLHCEEAFLNDPPESIHGLSPVEVQPGRRTVLQRMETGAARERLARRSEGMPTQRLE